MSGPLSRNQLLAGLEQHLVQRLELSPDNDEEMDGVHDIASVVMEYLMDSCRGAPPGASRVLLWAVFSALWEKQTPQEDIDAFFGSVNVDLGSLFNTWIQARAQGKAEEATLVLIPGKLSEADIFDVTAALYAQRGANAT